jgi:hypothetical protein
MTLTSSAPEIEGDLDMKTTKRGVLSPTDIVAVLPRVFQDDTPEDKAAIQPLLNQIVVYPLSEFDGKMKTMDWKKTPAFPPPRILAKATGFPLK